MSQNAMLRSVSSPVMPSEALNHWRSSSMKVITACGVPQTWRASATMSS